MNSIADFLLKLILVASILNIIAIGAVSPPDKAPDVKHHYAMVKYIAENYGEFPLNRSQVFTGYTKSIKEFNHLAHPPLYYYLMATIYKMLYLDYNWTDIGRNLDMYGGVSASTGIEILRCFSWALCSIGHLGIYLLVGYLIRFCRLNPWIGLLSVLVGSFVPGFNHIMGQLNNDVACWMLWPFLTLTTVRIIVEGCNLRRISQLMFFAGLSILSKATMWPLVVLCVFASALRIVYDQRFQAIKNQSVSSSPVLTKTKNCTYLDFKLSEIYSSNALTYFWMALGLLSISLAATYLGSNYLHYNKFLPSYTSYYGLAKEQSKFFQKDRNFKEVQEEGLIQTIKYVISGGLERSSETLLGVMGRGERHSLSEATRAIIYFLILSTLLIAFNISQFVRNMPMPALLVAGFLIGSPLFFIFIFIVQSYAGHIGSGYSGAQGRYFIGYLNMFFIGLGLLTSPPMSKSFSRLALIAFNLFIGLSLIVIFVHPLFYLKRSTQSYDAVNFDKIISQHLIEQGFKTISFDLEPMPNQRQAKKLDKGKEGFQNFWQFNKQGASIGVKIPNSGGHQDLRIKLVLLAQGTKDGSANLTFTLRDGTPLGPNAESVKSKVLSNQSIQIEPRIQTYELELVSKNSQDPTLWITYSKPKYSKQSVWWQKTFGLFGFAYPVVLVHKCFYLIESSEVEQNNNEKKLFEKQEEEIKTVG